MSLKMLLSNGCMLKRQRQFRAGSLVLEDKQLEEVSGRAVLNADSLRGRGRSQPPLQFCLKLQAPLHLSLELGLKVGNLVLSLC